MDTITHSLLGAVTAQLGFRQRIGAQATWVAAAAAIVPDLDFLLRPIVSLTNVEHTEFNLAFTHRGLTHSLLFPPLFGLVIAGAWAWARRAAGRRRANGLNVPLAGAGPPADAGRASFGWLYGCVLVAMFTHPLLDWATSYGTQLLSPLSDRRFALDAVPIVDIFYTPILILTLVACLLVRKFGPPSRRRALLVGWAGFLLSVGYIVAGLGARHEAIALARRSLAATTTSLRTDRADWRAYPQLGSILVWRVTCRTPEAWRAARISLLHPPAPGEVHWETAAIVSDRWVAEALAQPEVEHFTWFAGGEVRAVSERGDGEHIVYLHDMRYGKTAASLESMWPMRVAFGPDGRVLDVSRTHVIRGRSFRQLAAESWRNIWSP